MHIVSWNCRGLRNSSKYESVKYLIKMDSLDILLLQETKIEEETILSLIKMKWKKNTRKAVSAQGSSGGIATLWSEDTFLLENSFETHHWIYIELCHTSSKISLALFNLYVSVNFLEKKECWNSLTDFIATYAPSNIIVVDDLNIIMDPKEKKGGVYGRDPMHKMVENFIQLWDLLDFKPKKGDIHGPIIELERLISQQDWTVFWFKGHFCLRKKSSPQAFCLN